MNCDGITIINIGDLMLEKKDDKSIDYVSKIINKFKMQNIDVTSRKIDSNKLYDRDIYSLIKNSYRPDVIFSDTTNTVISNLNLNSCGTGLKSFVQKILSNISYVLDVNEDANIYYLSASEDIISKNYLMNYKKIINMVKLYNSCLKRICDEYKIKFIDINYIINKTSKKGIYIDDKSHDALSKYLINKILQPDDKEYELQKKII